MKALKILKISLCSVFLFSQTVYSEVKLGKDLTLTPSVGVASQKIGGTSGIVANRNQPSLNAGLSLNHSTGIYALFSIAQDQQDRANVATLGNYNSEICSVLGFNKAVAAATLDLSFEDCYVNQRTNKHNGTYYITASTQASKDLELSATYWISDTDGANGAGATGAIRYAVDGTGFNFGGAATTEVGKLGIRFGVSEKNTEWLKISLAKEIFGLNADLSYWMVSSVNDSNYVSQSDQKANERSHLILGVSKSF